MKKKPVEIDKKKMQEIGDRILKAVVDADLILDPDGPVMATVKYEDSSFRKRTISPGMPFFMDYVYVGARGDLIFGLSTDSDATADPEPDGRLSTRRWQWAEFTAKQLDDTFPLVLNKILDALDGSATSLPGLIKHLYDVQLVQDEREEENVDEVMRALPTFGMF